MVTDWRNTKEVLKIKSKADEIIRSKADEIIRNKAYEMIRGEAYDVIGFAHEELLRRANMGCEMEELCLFIDKKDKEIFFAEREDYVKSKDVTFLVSIKYQKSDHHANKNKTRRKFVNQVIMDDNAILRKIKIDLLMNEDEDNYEKMIKKLKQKEPLDTKWLNWVLEKLRLKKEFDDFYQSEAICKYFKRNHHKMDIDAEVVLHRVLFSENLHMY